MGKIDWSEYIKKEMEMKAQKKQEMIKLGSELANNPLCSTYSTAYMFAKFLTQKAADAFKEAHPTWNVEVGTALELRDE